MKLRCSWLLFVGALLAVPVAFTLTQSTGLDSDGDGLTDVCEALLGTDPHRADTDGDGLLDSWEVAGTVPAFAVSKAQAQPIPIAGANALRKDIFVEVDWMESASHSHRFRDAAIKRVQDAFNRAPVNNPSGEMGINIHIDIGQLGGGGDEVEELPILAIGTAPYMTAGFGDIGQGAAVAVGSIDANPAQDMLIMAYDNPAGPNNFRYQIAWNLDRDGKPTSWSGAINTPWSGVIQVAGVGDEGQGAGARLIDLNGNGRPELVLMAYDNPAGPNTFRYRIGWDLNQAGNATLWSNIFEVPGVGNEGQGAGLAFTNLDSDPRPEMILMAYDNPSGPNTFRYRIGWNLDQGGNATTWSNFIEVAGVGNEGQGTDVELADLDGNGRPEMILMAYDNPSGPNSYRYRIGWNLDTGGRGDWQGGFLTYPGTGNEGDGAGIAITNLDGGRPEMILLSYDAPSGPNNFRYNIAWNLDAAGNAVHYDYYKSRFFNPMRAGIYHYVIFAHDYWGGGSSSGLSFSSRDFVVTLGSWTGNTGTDADQSGAFMHELGHNLGLGHGGNSGINFKPNYPSIMNYANTYTVDVDFDGAIDGGLDYSHGFLAPLNESALDERVGAASFVSAGGVGNEGDGAGMAIGDIDRDGTPDLLLLAYDAPSGPNNLRYKIGYGLTRRGVPTRWESAFKMLPGMGDLGDGAGVALADLNGNGRLDMIVAVYDAPNGPNTPRWRIGWDLNRQGETSNWSRTIETPGLGNEGQGFGVAVTQLDADPRPDIMFAVYDNPPGPNNVRFKIGWNVSPGGAVDHWTTLPQVPGFGDEGQGLAIAVADVNSNGRPDLLVMAYDNPAGPNSFRLKYGWDLGTDGVPASWSPVTQISGLGNEGHGAGVALQDLDGDGRSEIFLMAYDNPAGPNTFRYRVGFGVDTAGNFASRLGFPRDWSGNGSIEPSVSMNLNGDRDGMGNPIFGTLTDFNDWANLKY
jgi:Bacterial TSP3 repeat